MKGKGCPEEKAWRCPHKGCRKEATLRGGTFSEGKIHEGIRGGYHKGRVGMRSWDLLRSHSQGVNTSAIVTPLVQQDSCRHRIS